MLRCLRNLSLPVTVGGTGVVGLLSLLLPGTVGGSVDEAGSRIAVNALGMALGPFGFFVVDVSSQLSFVKYAIHL